MAPVTLRQAALIAEPEIRFGCEIGHGMFAKKFRSDFLFRGLVGDGFETVFAKLGDAAMLIGIGPRATLAVEAIHLI